MIPNHQYPNNAQYFPLCVDWVTQQLQFYLSLNHLQSNSVFLQILAKQVSEKMYKHGQKEKIHL